MFENISREPIQNKVKRDLPGGEKAWAIVGTDGQGNILALDSIGWEQRLDYLARTDGQPTYLGYAYPETAEASATWLIQKFTFNSSGFVTRRQVATNVAWSDRTTSF